MKKTRMYCAAVLLLVAGCAADPKFKSWSGIGEADLRALQPGVTTQAEVLKRLGEPQVRSNFERRGEEVWDYRYVEGAMEMLAWVTFDLQGKYKSYASQPDPARYSTGAH